MFTVRSKFLFPAAIAALGFPVAGMAATIDAGLSIVGSVVNEPLPGNPGSTFNESLYSVVGGVQTNSSPVSNVAITDTGDGYGHVASLTGDSTSTDTRGADYTITATNNTTDTYELTFGILYNMLADSESGNLDARSVSELKVGLPFGGTGLGDEYLRRDLTSESGKDYYDLGNPTWQDQVDFVYQGTWGAALTASDTAYFTVELVAGAQFDFGALYTLRGRTFDNGATFSASSDMFIFLDSFENKTNPNPPGPGEVPLPASLPILAGGLGLMAFLGRRRRA